MYTIIPSVGMFSPNSVLKPAFANMCGFLPSQCNESQQHEGLAINYSMPSLSVIYLFIYLVSVICHNYYIFHTPLKIY